MTTIDPARWMTQLVKDSKAFINPSRRRLNQLSIPGTHDSCAFGLDIATNPFAIETYINLDEAPQLSLAQVAGCFAFTQWNKFDITAQLNAGIRFFDLRPRFAEGPDDDAPIYHGPLKTTSTLRGVLKAIADFIKDSQEAVIVRIKEEGGGAPAPDVTRKFGKIMAAVSQGMASSPFFSPPPKDQPLSAPPTLAECAGKIYTMEQTGGLAELSPYTWGNANVQDQFEVEIPESDASVFVTSVVCNTAEVVIPCFGLFSFVYKVVTKEDICRDNVKKVARPLTEIVIRDVIFDRSELRSRARSKIRTRCARPEAHRKRAFS
jgi:hypothetical protein